MAIRFPGHASYAAEKRKTDSHVGLRPPRNDKVFSAAQGGRLWGACAAGQFLTPHFSFLIIMYYYTPKPPFPQSFSAICGKTA